MHLPPNPRGPGPFRRFIGLDLGGGKGKKTALAVLDLNESGVAVTRLAPRPTEPPLYDDALVGTIRELASEAPTALCIDAPLSLPPCVRCRVPVCPGQEACVDPAVLALRALAGSGDGAWDRARRRGKPQVTPYTQRATELYLHRHLGVLPRETLGQGMGPLTARAAHVLRLLADTFTVNRNVFEVYPKATLTLLHLGDRHKKRVDERLRALTILPDLGFGPGVWREACVQSDHAFDAVISAYTGYRAQRDAWHIPPELAPLAEADGWIWTPPPQDGVPDEAEGDPEGASPTIRRASDG